MIPKFNDIKANNDLSRLVCCRSSLPLLLPLAGGIASAQPSFVHQAENPFDNNSDGLLDLGMAPESRAGEKHFAEVVKALGEASMTDNGLDTGEQAGQFAFDQVRDTVSEQINQQLESWLSPWGNASVGLQVDNEGSSTGSRGNWFIPWQDNQRYLTWSQLGLTQQDEGLASNTGTGQRWVRDDWFPGYNTFYDNLLDENPPRGGLGAEVWGEYLRLSANYYQPLSSWQERSTTQEQRMARGYDLTAQMRMPFYQHLNISVSAEQYFGDRVNLFHSGTGYYNPVAVNLGLSYAPVPLITMMAQHKQGEGGISQNNLGLTLNYRFGVPLKKQLMISEVTNSRSLRGGRYNDPWCNNLPTLEYHQCKTLSVFLTTPPWNLESSETVALKLQVRSLYGIRHLTWQGGTQVLSLTAGSDNRSAQGWTIIMPKWDSSEDAANRWWLSMVVEDEQDQRVSPNEITLSLTEPFITVSESDPR